MKIFIWENQSTGYTVHQYFRGHNFRFGSLTTNMFMADRLGVEHGTDIFPILPNLNYDEQCDGAWILQEFYYWGQEDSDDEAYTVAYSNEAILEEKFVWALTMIMFSNQEVGARILLSIFLDFIHTKRLSSSVINSTGC
jgi:hypothetical protein